MKIQSRLAGCFYNLVFLITVLFFGIFVFDSHLKNSGATSIIVQQVPTPTPTGIFLPTMTALPSATPTMTATVTATRTPTRTLTFTPTHTFTITSTLTPSYTPGPSHTPTSTYTPTHTLTPTATPTPITPTSPPNATMGSGFFTSSTLVLTWSRISWAVGYQIQVDDDPTFGSPIEAEIGTDTLSYTTLELPNGTYYWRVRAKRTATTWGNWSRSESFTVSAP